MMMWYGYNKQNWNDNNDNKCYMVFECWWLKCEIDVIINQRQNEWNECNDDDGMIIIMAKKNNK